MNEINKKYEETNFRILNKNPGILDRLSEEIEYLIDE